MTHGRITVLAATLALAVSGIAATPARADPDGIRIFTVQAPADNGIWGMDRGGHRSSGRDRDRFYQQRYTAPGDRDQGAPHRYTAPRDRGHGAPYRYTAPRDRDIQVQWPRYRNLPTWPGRSPDLWRW